MRVLAGAMVASLLLLTGCIESSLPSPAPSSSTAAGQAGTTCVGTQAASTYVLNLNATPPLTINGAKVGVSAIGTDVMGPWADLTVADGDTAGTFRAKRVGDTLTVGGTPMKVTHICVVDDLPTPMAPGTSRGTVGLANG